MTQGAPRPEKSPHSWEIGDLDRVRDARRQATWSLSMSERLARVHQLSHQMSVVKGAARKS